jgi:hypothetical protein
VSGLTSVLDARHEARTCLSWLSTQTAQIRHSTAALQSSVELSRERIEAVKVQQQALTELDSAAHALRKSTHFVLACLQHHVADTERKKHDILSQCTDIRNQLQGCGYSNQPEPGEMTLEVISGLSGAAWHELRKQSVIGFAVHDRLHRCVDSMSLLQRTEEAVESANAQVQYYQKLSIELDARLEERRQQELAQLAMQQRVDDLRASVIAAQLVAAQATDALADVKVR